MVLNILTKLNAWLRFICVTVLCVVVQVMCYLFCMTLSWKPIPLFRLIWSKENTWHSSRPVTAEPGLRPADAYISIRPNNARARRLDRNIKTVERWSNFRSLKRYLWAGEIWKAPNEHSALGALALEAGKMDECKANTRTSFWCQRDQNNCKCWPIRTIQKSPEARLRVTLPFPLL